MPEPAQVRIPARRALGATIISSANRSFWDLILQAPTEPGDTGAPPYSAGEEIANSVTHGIGAALGLAGLVVLIVPTALNGGDAWRLVSFSIYGSSLFMLYLASTLYHCARTPRLKAHLKTLDHSAIFLLIAGTYTPFLLVGLRSSKSWTLFGVLWGIALVGIVLKLAYGHRLKKFVTALPYILMGWLCMFILPEMIEQLPEGTMLWVILGGGLYTGGVGFYVWKRLPYHHAIWHLFVLGGSVCHFLAVLIYLVPAR